MCPCRQPEGRVFRQADPDYRRSSPTSSFLALVGFVGLCQLVGLVAGVVTAQSVSTWYAALAKPAGTPPNWVFPVAWTILYALIGTAAWMVWRQLTLLAASLAPLRLWGWQLLVNALWTPAFFGLRSPGLGLAVILALLVAAGLTIRSFAAISRPAAWVMLPYAAWIGYATWLNAGLWWLN